LLLCAGAAATDADPHAIPAVDGAIGSCSVDFTVKDGADAPVYNAKIRVHIAYGFLNAHKLDLEVGTNVDGKARFTGLPSKVKQPLFFDVSEGDRNGNASYDPADNCKAERSVVLVKGKKDGAQP